MSLYILGPDAELDLDAIWEYIAKDNIDAADRWISRLFGAFEALGQTPGMGHVRETLLHTVDAYLIIYRTGRDRSRDIPAFLLRRL